MWVLLIAILIILAFGTVQQGITNTPFGDKPVPDVILLFALVLFTLLFFMFLLLRLKTRINSEAIHVNFRPFVTMEITWASIKSIEVLNYGFVGGWGIRLWTTYGTAYNIKGNKGLAIKLKSGKKYLIGTQKPEELQQFLETLTQAQTLLKSKAKNISD